MIGPTFGDELRAANLHDGVSWNSEGVLTFNKNIDEKTRAAVSAVLAAHDPVRVLTKAPALADKILTFISTLPNCPQELKDAANTAANVDKVDF